jgi:hypothetical protein
MDASSAGGSKSTLENPEQKIRSAAAEFHAVS